MSGPDIGTVRVVRGAPRPEEVAALLVVLVALADSAAHPHNTPSPPAPWTRDCLGLSLTSGIARRLPAWRAR